MATNAAKANNAISTPATKAAKRTKRKAKPANDNARKEQAERKAKQKRAQKRAQSVLKRTNAFLKRYRNYILDAMADTDQRTSGASGYNGESGLLRLEELAEQNRRYVYSEHSFARRMYQVADILCWRSNNAAEAFLSRDKNARVTGTAFVVEMMHVRERLELAQAAVRLCEEWAIVKVLDDGESTTTALVAGKLKELGWAAAQ